MYTMIKLGHIILKEVNCVHSDQIWCNSFEGVNWVHYNKMSSNGLERSQLSTQYIKSGQMVLKGVNWVHNGKIWSNGLERSAKISS